MLLGFVVRRRRWKRRQSKRLLHLPRLPAAVAIRCQFFLRISPPHLLPVLLNHLTSFGVGLFRHLLQFEQPWHWHFNKAAEYRSEADAMFGKRGPAWMRPART